MKVCDYKGYEIHLPTSGGKAGWGRNVTSTIQVRNGTSIVKQFRFTVADDLSVAKAKTSARLWINEHPISHER